MASSITADQLKNLRVPQHCNSFGGVPLYDLVAMDPTELFTASTAALPAAGTYCAPAVPLVHNPSTGVFVFLWEDGWKFAEIFPLHQHASAVENTNGTFALWTLKRRIFSAVASGSVNQILHGLRGVYRGVFTSTAGSALLPTTDPVRVAQTGQVAFADTITHDGGLQFREGPTFVGGQGLNARTGLQFDAENSIGCVLVARCGTSSKMGFEIGGL